MGLEVSFWLIPRSLSQEADQLAKRSATYHQNVQHYKDVPQEIWEYEDVGMIGFVEVVDDLWRPVRVEERQFCVHSKVAI
jgi:hypothetical protein